MGKPLSVDLRSRLVAAVANGLSRRAAAGRFGVSAASAIRWVAASTSTGTIAPKPQDGNTCSHHIEAFADVILAAIEAQKDVSLIELAELLRTAYGVSFAPSTVWRFLDRHAMTFKKTAHTSEQTRPDAAARRQAWFGGQPDLDPECLVFLDKTGASTKMARQRNLRRREW
ncbi:winged helix-turn-helix domain-containing protein [Roseococcus sp.]|uniref:winged helix-turn-helix domain-containing protein n=1 Tax=Roseococcus sp. TaxID=2109646 RepID=UPI003BAD659C